MTELKCGLAEQLPPPEWLTPRDGPAVGMRLAFRAYLAAGKPRANVLVSHGFAEHSGWWQHVALAFQARGYSAYLFDHYHHGASAGRVADVPHFNVLAAGIRCALEAGVLPRAEGRPVVLLGHSNGGCASVFGLPEFAAQLTGLVLSSPLIQLPWVSRWLGMIPALTIAKFRPDHYWPLPLHPPRLTNNAPLWPAYTADPLRFHKISPRFYLAMRAACEAVEARTGTEGLPLLLLSAGQEQVVNKPAMLRWYGRLTTADKTHRDYAGRQHELFNEVDWPRYVEDVVAWMEARIPAL